MALDRLLLLISTIAFLAGLLHAIVSIRAGSWKESRWHILPMAAGFLCQCGFLYLRGNQHGRCPITNLFEVFIFIGWCIVLLYFLVGTAYRLSLLGVFTAPLVAVLQTIVLLSPLDTPTPVKPPNYWGELHASVALIAYAAFALACISGVMFLMQDRLLKRHKINALFHQLPPIHQLSKAIQRLIFWGVLLLGFAMAITFKIPQKTGDLKVVVSWVVLGLYAAIYAVMLWRALTAKQVAWLAVVGFLVPFVSLWVVTKV